MSETSHSLVIGSAEELWRTTTRRSFLKLLGFGGTVVLLPTAFEACNKPTGMPNNTGTAGNASASLDLSTDTGILNYAYALEQLEAGFYTAVVASAAFGGLTAEQKEVFTSLQGHEVIHREFFRTVLGTNAIGTLALNNANVTATLGTAASILKTAEAFEDLGVSAFNGAGKYLKNPAYLTIAGKIVSVEARHAAAIRDMRDALGVKGGTAAGTRFGGDDVVAASGKYAGLDVKLEPSAVLSRVAATGFVSTNLSIGTTPPTTAGTPDAGPPSPTP